MKKVSIIIPAYNVSEYLEFCVQSLLNQTYSALEILIIDDGSKDATPQVCDKLSKTDSRVIVYHKKNAGVSSTRNFGIQRATGDYIMFVDGDDWVDSNYVEDMIQCIVDAQSDGCFCNKYYKNNTLQIATSLMSTGTLDAKELLKRHLRYGFIASPCFSLLSRQCVSTVLFNESIHTLEDWEYNFRCLTKFKSICILDNAYYHYRTVEGSASASPLNHRKLTCFNIPDYVNDYIKENNLQLEKEAKYVPVFLIYHMLVCYSFRGAIDSAEIIVRDFARKTLKDVIFSRTVDVKYKLYLILASIHPILFKKLFIAKYKK